MCNNLASLPWKMCTCLIESEWISSLCRLQTDCLGQVPWGPANWHWGMCSSHHKKGYLCKVLSLDILKSVGPCKLYVGNDSGCEAVIHVTREIFASITSDAFLTVDVTNAFNSLNSWVALRNITKICPSLAKILMSTYCCCCSLFSRQDCHISIMLVFSDALYQLFASGHAIRYILGWHITA